MYKQIKAGVSCKTVVVLTTHTTVSYEQRNVYTNAWVQAVTRSTLL